MLSVWQVGLYRAHMHLDLGWDHLIWAREQAITEGSLKQNSYINVWLLSLASGALDSKYVQKSKSVWERTHGYCLSIFLITGLCAFMAMGQIFIKAKEEVREKLKQKDRMGAIKTQDRVGEPISCLPIASSHLHAHPSSTSLGNALKLRKGSWAYCFQERLTPEWYIPVLHKSQSIF